MVYQNTNPFSMTAQKGSIAMGPNQNKISVQLYGSSTATLVPGDWVKLQDTTANTILVEKAAVTDAVIGCVMANPKKQSFVAYDNFEIALNGSIIYLESAAAIARGADLEFVISGAKVQTNAGVNTICGTTLDKASGAGQLVRVLVKGTFAFSPTVTGGSINSTPIGQSSAAAGSFTLLQATSETVSGKVKALTFAAEVVALTPAATISLNPALADVFTLTPTASETINAASVVSGQRLNLVITTSGASSFTITLGTGFTTTGTLATGTVTGKIFVMSFVSDGTAYREVSRTTAM
jgi:hypothetical protein